MDTLTINHKNGSASVYKLIEGDKPMKIAYKNGTPNDIINIIERCRKNRIRVILDFGDTQTGRSWNEEHDICGYIGLSKGNQAYFPILLYNSRSYGGGDILTHCIVKISESKDKKVLYQHPKYSNS